MVRTRPRHFKKVIEHKYTWYMDASTPCTANIHGILENHTKMLSLAGKIVRFYICGHFPRMRYICPFSPSAPCEGTNSPRLFTPGETKALAESKVHQISRAWVTVRVSVGGHPH
jgi:hypothetical protein